MTTTNILPALGAGLTGVTVLMSGTTAGQWAPPAPPINPGSATITFAIARFDNVRNADLIAPVDCWFGPAAIQGAMGVNGQPISEPALNANAYDPTQTELFWSWGFDDAGYTPRFTPNLPLSMRDLNRSRVKRPTHVFTQPGPKTVSAFVFDAQGGWGTATYVFGPGGQAPAIIDPNGGVFTGRDLYFSPQGIFPAEVPAGDRFTTASALNNRIIALSPNDSTQSHAIIRVRTRRGEEYVNIAQIGAARHVYIDSYGSAADPAPKHIRTNTLPAGVSGQGSFSVANGDSRITQGLSRIIDQDWQGPYDSAADTGRRFWAFTDSTSRNGQQILYTRCSADGFAKLDMTASSLEMWRTIHDCRLTNWQDYGLYASDGGGLRNIAVLGCDIFQKVDALSGVPHGAGSGNPWDMGTRHGPMRHGEVRTVHVQGTSLFNRTGWSISSFAQGTTIQPTTAQACWRYGAGEDGVALCHHGFESNTFEGGNECFAIVDLNGRPSNTYPANFVFDGNVFVGSTQTGAFNSGALIAGKCRGLAVRNNYFLSPSVTQQYDGTRVISTRAVEWNWTGAAPTGPNGVYIHNNSWLFLAATAQFGAGTRTMAQVNANHAPQVVESNVVHAPNLTVPTIGPTPLSTSTLAGFTPRYMGDRWNFLAYGSLNFSNFIVQDRREQPGSPGVLQPGPVAPGEWMFFPYPNYTGQCRGAGRQTTQADFADPTRYHQVSCSGSPTIKNASTVAAGDQRDLVAFRFDANGFAVQNRSGATISLGDIWMLMDLPQMRMALDTSRATPPASMLWLFPAVGSAARVPARTAPWPAVDIGGTARAGMRQSSSVVTPEGVNFAGALAAVPT